MRRVAALVLAVTSLTGACGGAASPVSPAPTSQPAARATEPPATIAGATATAATIGLDSPQVAPFRRMADALNQGDANAALAGFAEEAIWERGGQCPPGACVGKQAVQRELTRDVAAHHQLILLSADGPGNAPTVRLELRNGGTRRAAVDRVVQFFALEVRDGKIAAVRVSFDMSDAITARFVASQAGTQR